MASTGFWTIICFLPGCMPNITRNAIVNCAELVTYDMIKELILKYDLMTGEAKESTDISLSDASSSTTTKYDILLRMNEPLLLFPSRQPALSLHSSFWCRLLYNSCGFSCGRSKNTLHELRGRSVQQRNQLCSHHDEKWRTHSFL